MPSPGASWYDEEAGPVVRPYAMIRGRTRPRGDRLDLIALVVATGRAPADRLALSPEHVSVLRMCRVPVTVADLASELGLPLGVVRILLDDLRESGLLRAARREPPAQLPDPAIMREVADALRRL